MDRLERFLAKVEKGPDCWMWTASKNAAGYGNFSWAGTKRVVASRASYELFVGPIPDGFEVDHLCRNRSCVNPAHLEAVSVAVNRARREVARGQQTRCGKKTHCKQGHPLSGDNLRVDARTGMRVCRACAKENARRWRERRAR